jgi:hypothetical protein
MTMPPMSQDGVEIHFDQKRGYLELACEPDAFAPYREIAREQLKEFPDISIDKVMEINIVDTETFVARRDAPKRRIGGIVVGGLVVLVLVLAVIGVCAIIAKIVA